MSGRITIGKQFYNDTQMTDMNSLANALLTYPEKLSPVLTHLGGREDKKFPLQALVEGVGNTKSIEKLDYEYDVTTRIDHTRPLAVTNSASNLGKGGAFFELVFPDKWFIKDHILISKSGIQVRIMSQPVAVGTNYKYMVRLVTPDPNVVFPAGDATGGSLFGQMFAPVGTDWSRGNASNWAAPFKVRHKLTTCRKSYQMSGNAKDYVVNIGLTMNGKKTNLWMDYEEWQYMLQWKEVGELMYWYAEQSYNDQGVTGMVDENNQPVVIGPGILQQIPNRETYSVLTANKIKTVMGDLFYGMTDAQQKQVVLYTGLGGMREFDEALKAEAASHGYTATANDKFITGSGRNMTLTGFFTTYEHIDGHTVKVVHNPLFDQGVVAQTRAKHPTTGWSLESYRMVFVDQSNYDGESNILMVNKKGREMLRWAVAGSIIPRGFSGNLLRASDVDGASVHYLKTGGILLRRFDTSLDMQCIAS